MRRLTSIGRPLAPALVLLVAAALGASPALAEEEIGEVVPIPPDLPAATAAPKAPARPPADLSLPDWLGQVTGLASPRTAPHLPEKRFHWDVLPFFVTNPLMGVGGGVAGVGAFRLGDPERTGWSSFAGSAIVTSHSQQGISLRSDVRLPDDAWILVEDWSVSHFPNPAWGPGSLTPDSNQTIVQRTELRLHETVFRHVVSGFFAGAGWFFDQHYGITDQRAALGEVTAFTSYGIGVHGNDRSSGPALSLLWDRRDNPLNPGSGIYGVVRYRMSPRLLGSDQSWQSLWLEGRAYLPVPGRPDTLALWAYAWSTFGETPYLMLPSIGVDPDHRSGRGYIEARHVGPDLLGAEAEYRFRIWQFVGGVVGGNVHTVSERDPAGGDLHFGTWSAAAVVGLRLLLDTKSLTNVAIDLAYGRDGLAFYVNFGEAF